MFQRLHPEIGVNYQLNRWLELGGEGMLPGLRDAATRITDAESYARELRTLAERRQREGDLRGAGALLMGAEFFLLPSDPRRRELREAGAGLLRRRGGLREDQRFAVPFAGGSLPCLRIDAQNPRGAVVMHGGFDSYIDELMPAAAHCARSGWTTVVFEGPGQGGALEDHGLHMSERWHEPVGAVLDHCGLRDVALFGISLGGALAIHAAAQEARITRVICDDITCDFQAALLRQLPEPLRNVVTARLAAGDDDRLDELFASDMERNAQLRWAMDRGRHVFGVARPSAFLRAAGRLRTVEISGAVTADVLLLAGAEDHYVPVEQLYTQAAALTAARSVSTRLLTAADGAEQHCHVGNVQLSLTLATNWLAEIQLAALVRAAPPTERAAPAL